MTKQNDTMMSVKQKWKRFVDKAIYPIGLMSPLLTYIQAAKIWFNKDASGVSLLAWGGYTVISFFWLNYGVFNKVKPLILVEALAIIGYILIVIGTVAY